MIGLGWEKTADLLSAVRGFLLRCTQYVVGGDSRFEHPADPAPSTGRSSLAGNLRSVQTQEGRLADSWWELGDMDERRGCVNYNHNPCPCCWPRSLSPLCRLCQHGQMWVLVHVWSNTVYFGILNMLQTSVAERGIRTRRQSTAHYIRQHPKEPLRIGWLSPQPKNLVTTDALRHSF